MDITLGITNSSRLQVPEFILLGLPGIHEWQQWLSLPLTLLCILALGASLLMVITSQHEAMLHVLMYHFLGILAVVDMGLATMIMPKILSSGLMPRPSASLSALLRSMPSTLLWAWSQASSSAWLSIDM